MDGVAPTIIKDDFTSADQNEFELLKSVSESATSILRHLSKIFSFVFFPEKFAFYFGYTYL